MPKLNLVFGYLLMLLGVSAIAPVLWWVFVGGPIPEVTLTMARLMSGVLLIFFGELLKNG